MTEILSQDEIDALLTAISTGEVDASDYSPEKQTQKKVKIYDFRRPDKFSKDHIRTLQMMHETFARLTTTALSAQLRALVGVHVASVDQLTYEEFIRSIPNPTTLAVINMDPLKGSAVLEIDPSITFTIIDKLFGGLGEASKINRELTDIELSVMEGIIVRILGNLREAWSNVIDLRPRLGTIETNPQFAQIVPPNDMVVLITLETKVGDVEGMTNLCIPYISIEPIISKLSAQYMYSSIRKGSTDENAAIIQARLDNVKLPILAEIGGMQLLLQDVLNLKVGDVVKLPDTTINSDMIVKIGGRKKFKCRPGVVSNRIAVKLGEPIEEVPDDLLTSSRAEDEFG
jgi:flagellar motor switch protein FliM